MGTVAIAPATYVVKSNLTKIEIMLRFKKYIDVQAAKNFKKAIFVIFLNTTELWVKKLITIVPENYIPGPCTDGINWDNPRWNELKDSKQAFHAYKFIRDNDKNIISETDEFYSGETYNAPNPES